MTKSALEQLKAFSTVVADTGDLESIKIFRPRDATTNPSLILKAAQQEQYREILEKTISDNKNRPLSVILNSVIVNFGSEILKLIDGRVSSEVDARYSFDTAKTVECAQNIIELYQKNGISRERILIKIAATWEGISAAEILENSGIHCNLTLIFSLVQAAVCAEKNVTLISPFVGRILDWYKKNNPQIDYSIQDPGVESVTEIFEYYKSHGFSTEIMGASFRNIDEVLLLAGCDLLTISPKLLEELSQSDRNVDRKLTIPESKSQNTTSSSNESHFRFTLNENAMATEKLSEGIRTFAQDTRKLEEIIGII
ncbi:MAG: transaldolase [Opitutales bacterium]|nr:transaldolase [Opitutales bacterium]